MGQELLCHVVASNIIFMKPEGLLYQGTSSSNSRHLIYRRSSVQNKVISKNGFCFIFDLFLFFALVGLEQVIQQP